MKLTLTRSVDGLKRPGAKYMSIHFTRNIKRAILHWPVFFDVIYTVIEWQVYDRRKTFLMATKVNS